MILKRFILLFLFITHSASFAERSITRLHYTGTASDAVATLTDLGADILYLNVEKQYANILIDTNQQKRIRDMAFSTEMLHPDADAYARQLRSQGYLEHFTSYTEMLSMMESLVASHPHIARLKYIGDTYEREAGRGGYEIAVLKISDNVWEEEDEPEVFYMANMHAREIITPEIILRFMHDLVLEYGQDPRATYLVNERQIWLCPSMNPDGYEYVLTGSNPNDIFRDPIWWRKNKRDNYRTGSFDPSVDGVDLNRNFGYLWGGIGSSGNPFSNTYRGTAPFSEPESQAIRDFVIEHRFCISLSFHSHGQLWLYPWGFARRITPDHDVFVALADSCVHYNGYDARLAAELYVVSGDTDDWFYGEQELKNKIYAFTPEVGNEAESVGGWTGFFPDTAYIEKQIAENQGPMYYLAYAAGEEPILFAQGPEDTLESGASFNVSAGIEDPIPLSDPAQLDEASVYVYYNTTGIAPFESQRLDPDPAQPDLFSGDIPVNGTGVDVYYYVSASDTEGRIGHAPRYAPHACLLYTS